MRWNASYPKKVFALAFLVVALGAMNSVLSSAYLPDILREFAEGADASTHGRIGAWINFAFLSGATVGGIALGFLSDRIGPWGVLLLAVLSYGAGSLAGGLVSGWELLVFTRIWVGIGVGAALVVSVVLVSESWDQRSRSVALGILSVAYPIGIVGSGLVTASITDWRSALLLGGGVSVLLIWPALRLMGRMPRQADSPADSARPSALADYRSALLSGILVYGTMLLGLWATFSWLPTWVESLMGVDAEGGQQARGLAMALLGFGGLAGGLASGFLGKRIGDRRVQASCFALCFVLSYGLFKLHSDYRLTVPVGIALLGIFFGISQGVLNDFIPALFPPAVRAGATALCFHIGRAFTAAAVFFVGALVVWFGGYGNAIFAFSTVYLAGLAALFIRPQGRAKT
jgi:MFS family permease